MLEVLHLLHLESINLENNMSYNGSHSALLKTTTEKWAKRGKEFNYCFSLQASYKYF